MLSDINHTDNRRYNMVTTVTQESGFNIAFNSAAPFGANDTKIARAIAVALPPTSAANLPDNQFYVKKIALKIDSSRPSTIKIPKWDILRNKPSNTSYAKTAAASVPFVSATAVLKMSKSEQDFILSILSTIVDGDRLSMVPSITIVNESTLSGTTIVSDITKPDRPEYPSDSVRDDFFKFSPAKDEVMLKYYQLEDTAAHHIFVSYSKVTKTHYILFDIFHNKLAANAGVQISMIQDSFDNPSSMDTTPIKNYSWSVVDQTVTKVSLLVIINEYSKTNFNNITLSVLIMGNQIQV